MPKIIFAISSQVIAGEVGLNAIRPALQALAYEIFACPTVLMASHPGAYPQADPPAKHSINGQEMRQLAQWLDDAGTACSAIISGYMPSLDHVIATADIVQAMRRKNPNLVYLCDPVCGDRGKLYIERETAEAIRDILLPLADIATPNLFELNWLSGQRSTTDDQIKNAARLLPTPHIVVTSSPTNKGYIATLRLSDQGVSRCQTKLEPLHIHGMGDTFAALYLGLHLNGEENALGIATATMAKLATKATPQGRLPSAPIILAASAEETFI